MDKITEFDQYQIATRASANNALDAAQQLTNYALGLCGEAGELSEIVDALDPRYKEHSKELLKAAARFAELVKKNVFHKHYDEFTMKKRAIKEAGDVLWYLVRMCELLQVAMSDVATANIAKLRERYANGFSADASKNRKDESHG